MSELDMVHFVRRNFQDPNIQAGALVSLTLSSDCNSKAISCLEKGDNLGTFNAVADAMNAPGGFNTFLSKIN